MDTMLWYVLFLFFSYQLGVSKVLQNAVNLLRLQSLGRKSWTQFLQAV